MLFRESKVAVVVKACIRTALRFGHTFLPNGLFGSLLFRYFLNFVVAKLNRPVVASQSSLPLFKKCCVVGILEGRR